MQNFHEPLMDTDSHRNKRIRLTDRESRIQKFNQRQKSERLNIPTSDVKVKTLLRMIRQPICLFGEKEIHRRERLKVLLGELSNIPQEVFDFISVEEEKKSKARIVHTEALGTEEFFDFRKSLVLQSLERAKNRIKFEAESKSLNPISVKKNRQEKYSALEKYTLQGSQIVSERPVSCCRFVNENTILTGSWDSTLRLFHGFDLKLDHTFSGHTDRICGIDTFDDFVTSSDNSGGIFLWSLSKRAKISDFKGHQQRVSSVAFHPSGSVIGSVSHDATWCLWDVHEQKQLVKIGGHSKGINSLSFHSDHALCFTGGLDAIGRIWDLRTMNSIWALQGHAKSILCSAFSPNGYQLVTGSEDDCIRVWDLRKLENVSCIPAHLSSVTDLKFRDSCIVSCSLDKTAKIWGAFDFRLLNTLESTDKLLGIDQICDKISTVGFDRTIKLWA